MTRKSFYGKSLDERLTYSEKARQDGAADGVEVIDSIQVFAPGGVGNRLIQTRFEVLPLQMGLEIVKAIYMDGDEFPAIDGVTISVDAFHRMATSLGYTKGGS